MKNLKTLCLLSLLSNPVTQALFASSPAAIAEVHPDLSEQRLVWAHYVPWHTPLNTPLTPQKYYSYPLLEAAPTNLVAWAAEFALAKEQGIDGFFVDVVYKPDTGGVVFDSHLMDMLEAAEGMDFYVALCLDVKTTVEQQVRELARMLDKMAPFSSYPKVDGKPVVATYTWKQWTPEEWAEILSQLKAKGYEIYLIANVDKGYSQIDAEWLESYAPYFDMAYTFGAGGLDGRAPEETAALVRDVALANGKQFMPTLWPGYYGAWLNGRNDYYQPHLGFDRLHDDLKSVDLASDSWLHLTTWNDHDETSIMPMLFTPANFHVIKAYSNWFKGIEPDSKTPEVCFAYHREELPGTLLRFEALSLPFDGEGEVAISGRLLSPSGDVVATFEEKSVGANDFARVEWLVSSLKLAKYSTLTPEFTVKGNGYDRTAKLPQVFLVTGWHQNAVTVKVAHADVFSLDNELSVSVGLEGEVYAAVSYDSPEPLKSATLFMNDRPLGNFSSESDDLLLLNLSFTTNRRWELRLEGGVISDAICMFNERDSDALRWDAHSAAAAARPGWEVVALQCKVSPDAIFELSTHGQEKFIMTASELAETQRVSHADILIQSWSADLVTQNKSGTPLPSSGESALAIYAGSESPSDSFYVRYVSESGKVAYSDVVFPLGSPDELVASNVLLTSISLETTSGASGEPGKKEFLSEHVPFNSPTLQRVAIPVSSIRAAHWNFDNGGQDSTGNVSVRIPEKMLSGDGNGVLLLDGTDRIKMPVRTWPIGSSTVEFLIKPEGGREKPQSILYRVGWSDGINVNLLEDGRVEVVRNGSSAVGTYILKSVSTVPDGEWSRVRVVNDLKTVSIYIDGELDSSMPLPPERSYGNSTWFIGGGYPGCDYFVGELDDLTVSGGHFVPGDPYFPISEFIQ